MGSIFVDFQCPDCNAVIVNKKLMDSFYDVSAFKSWFDKFTTAAAKED